MPSRLRSALFVTFVLGSACSPAPSDSGAVLVADLVQFEDATSARGVDYFAACGNVDKNHILETLGTGVAIADYDNDGDQDFYLTTAQTSDDWTSGRRSRTNALYRNDGSGHFTEVAQEAGVALAAWSLGAYFVDHDNDGDKDLFVTTWGHDRLFVNDGTGTFHDGTDAAGVAGPESWSSSAAFGDLDLDGDLDLYVASYAKYSLVDPPLSGATMTWRGLRVFMGPVGLEAEPDRLYRNNGDGSFSEVTQAAGLDESTSPHYGLGVVFSDFDRDGDPDIFVANDTMANFLWRNDGALHFKEVALGSGVATDENAREQAGMGADAGDFDDDNDMDIVVTNFSHDFNTLHENQGQLRFTDATHEANFKDSYRYLVWGTKFFDYDLDGWLDVAMANGHIYSVLETHTQANATYRQRNSLYRNQGDGSFEPVAQRSGSGMAIEESTRGLAVGDLDGDGDPDLILTNIDAPPNVLINMGGTAHHWLHVALRGQQSNRDGIGARIEVTAGGRTQYREVNPYGSFLSQSSFDVIVGLAQAETIERVVVIWPSGVVDEVQGIESDQRIEIVEGVGLAGTLP